MKSVCVTFDFLQRVVFLPGQYMLHANGEVTSLLRQNGILMRVVLVGRARAVNVVGPTVRSQMTGGPRHVFYGQWSLQALVYDILPPTAAIESSGAVGKSRWPVLGSRP